MGNRKPDYSKENIPKLLEYCKKNGLDFYWKSEEHGHAVVSNATTEAYVWVQRMVIGVRKRGGVELSKTLYHRSEHHTYQFSPKTMNRMLQIGNVQTHTTKEGIRVTRRKAVSNG